MSSRTRVLVVDDSAVIRQGLAQILGGAGLVVDTAADPLIALGKMERARPDVILLDLEMPRMDGLTFLRRLMREHPVPVVVLSSHAERGTETALAALEEGAVEVLAKPPLGIREFLEGATEQLIEVVRAASRARLLPRRGPAGRANWRREDSGAERRPPRRLVETPRVIALTASTGGPEALRTILSRIPADGVPGIVIVQHMPAAFTPAFARRLDEASPLSVWEAGDGDLVSPGTALVAPGGRHLEVVATGSELRVRLSDGPPLRQHRPSGDVLFQSVAGAVGSRAVGVILTGMGNDGAEGLLAMRRAGAVTLAQDEGSCVVYGMPARAAEIGAVERETSLAAMPGAILSCLPARGDGASRAREA